MSDTSGYIDNERALAIMAHDIKAPLAAVVSILDVINKGYINSDIDKIKELVNRATQKTESLIHMVDDILDYTLLADKTKMKRETVHLYGIFKESLSTMKPYADKQHISLTYSEEDLGNGKYVSGNKTFLLRAVNNLVMNAIKYNRENGNITVECWEENNEINIRVSDTGIGIPEDEVTKVFHIFERGRYARKNIDGSLGLGLSLVKQIVDDHDGKISVTSTVGVGTAITLTLPLLETKRTDKEGYMKHKILVVEDDIDVLEARRVILEHNNYEVLTATTIEVAKETLEKEKIDLILLDVMMEKDTDGFVFAQHVKSNAKFKKIPIIMITAVNQRTKFKFDIEKDGDFLPVEKFMEKPIDPDDLIVTIRGLLK